MPIRIQSDLPAKEILEKENIFVMDENRAMHQDIRPIKIGILNLMPLKEETELQLLRSLSNTPLQVDVTFVAVSSHESKNTSMSHLNKFYESFADIKRRYFDGLIITGVPPFYRYASIAAEDGKNGPIESMGDVQPNPPDPIATATDNMAAFAEMIANDLQYCIDLYND